MSMQDTVGDMLTRIRNAQMANKVSVAMPSSKLRKSIADLLVSEGYVASAVVTEQENNKATLTIELKYFEGKAVIETIQRYSRPGLRQVLRGKSAGPAPPLRVRLAAARCAWRGPPRASRTVCSQSAGSAFPCR